MNWIKKMTIRFSPHLTKEFAKKNKRLVTLILVATGCIVLVGGGLRFYKSKSSEPVLHETEPKTVEFKQQKKDGGEQTEAKDQSVVFSLKPSPTEVLQQLTSLENFNKDIKDSKMSGLRVLWPVYFFSLQEKEKGKAYIILDVSEDGFGITIESDVDSATYPQLQHLKSGEKIWIGGEILSVDQSGTGTIILRTEHFTFSEELPSVPSNRIKKQ